MGLPPPHNASNACINGAVLTEVYIINVIILKLSEFPKSLTFRIIAGGCFKVATVFKGLGLVINAGKGQSVCSSKQQEVLYVGYCTATRLLVLSMSRVPYDFLPRTLSRVPQELEWPAFGPLPDHLPSSDSARHLSSSSSSRVMASSRLVDSFQYDMSFEGRY